MGCLSLSHACSFVSRRRRSGNSAFLCLCLCCGHSSPTTREPLSCGRTCCVRLYICTHTLHILSYRAPIVRRLLPNEIIKTRPSLKTRRARWVSKSKLAGFAAEPHECGKFLSGRIISIHSKWGLSLWRRREELRINFQASKEWHVASQPASQTDRPLKGVLLVLLVVAMGFC